MLTTKQLFMRRKLRTRYNLKNRLKRELPRLSVFRSNKHIYAQIIDDVQGKTLVVASSVEKDGKFSGKGKEKAYVIGENIGKRAVDAGIKEIVFDRGGCVYHGRVKAVAEGARNAGLKF